MGPILWGKGDLNDIGFMLKSGNDISVVGKKTVVSLIYPWVTCVGFSKEIGLVSHVNDMSINTS